MLEQDDEHVLTASTRTRRLVEGRLVQRGSDLATDPDTGALGELWMLAAPAHRPITRWLVLGSKRFPPPGGRSPRELHERRAEGSTLAGLRIGGPFGG